MKSRRSLPLLLCLFALALPALPARAQDAPPSAAGEFREQMQHMPMPMHQFSAEQREEMRQHREARQRLSPEERHQLRHDIREAGRDLYPRRGRRSRD